MLLDLGVSRAAVLPIRRANSKAIGKIQTFIRSFEILWVFIIRRLIKYQNPPRWHVNSDSDSSLRWLHNRRDSVSNYQRYDCLLNRLFRRRSKKTSKLSVTGLCAGNSPGPVNSPHKWPVTRKMFPFDDVIMIITGIQFIFQTHKTVDNLIAWT